VLDAFDPPYMQRAALAALLLAVPLGLVGVWVVLRGLAFFTHAVGVATFPGVVVGLGVPALGPFGGALLACLAFAAAVTAVERDERLRGGAVTGLALAAALALGAVLLAGAVRVSAPVESVLFGSLLAITSADVVRCAVVCALALAAAAWGLPRLAAATFDAEWARGAGARVGRVEAVLLVLVALTVVVALPAAGNLLVSGLLVVPAAAARLLTERLGVLLALAVALCAAESLAGLALARALDVPPGAAIATLGGLVFAVAAAVRAGRA
jgi:ABC-type Mn2+/Zn2+ transport system permease subunit